MVGILGLETFRSSQAYVARETGKAMPQWSPSAKNKSRINEVSTYIYEKAPINYKDFAIGLGFDWDFSDRVGLHFRYKFMTHSDETVSENNWHSHYIAAETKAWF
jgi:hypothetical protein